MATLKNPNPEIRAAGAYALGSIGPEAKAAIPALLERLGDEELQKAGAAAKIGFGDLVPEALARMGSDAVPGLAEVLKDSKKPPLTRYAAVKALARIGGKARAALPVLEEGLRDRLAAVAVESACAYARAGGDVTKSLPVLRMGLKHDNAFIVWNAASAIERLGLRAKVLVPDLVPLLKHGDQEVRIVATRALCKMGSAAKPVVKPMAELLNTDSGRQQYQVANALSQLGPDARDAVPRLIERLKDKDFGGSSPDPVLAALGNIGPDAKSAVPALVGLLRRGVRFPEDVMPALGRIGPDAKDAVPVLIANLENRKPFVRAAAARALGGIGPDAKEAVPALKKLLGDQEKGTRVWAAYALGRITGDSKEQVAFIIDLWEEEGLGRSPGSGLVRYDAAQAFELLGRDARPARDLLLDALLDDRTPTGSRLHIARAIGQMRDDANMIVPKLIALTERPTKGFERASGCRCAAEALGLLGPKAKSAIPHLRKLLQEDDEVVEAALRALEKIESK
jgi:HEAT repeat protein